MVLSLGTHTYILSLLTFVDFRLDRVIFGPPVAKLVSVDGTLTHFLHSCIQLMAGSDWSGSTVKSLI